MHSRVQFPYGSPFYFGALAQLGERLPYKQRVTGSSPVRPTINKIVKIKLPGKIFIAVVAQQAEQLTCNQ